MKSKRPAKILFWTFIMLGLCTAASLFYDRGRPAPIPVKRELFEGVTYRRVVRFTPKPLIAHVIMIDTKVKEIGLLVTPPDSDGELPLRARTTSQFLDEFGVQIAINGDGFDPWWSHSPADYYPRVGEPVTPLGLTASDGKIYTVGVPREIGTPPTLFISRKNTLSFNKRPDRVFQAISGDRMLVLQGQIADDLEAGKPDPRTAIGMNKNGRYLFLVVVDGRQPFYSEGATFTQLAQLMIDQGAYVAMSLDGGGSSTMVIEGQDGKPVILNSPIDNYIPGRERAVANHLGVYVR
jgi:hypothetical protein